MQFHHETIDPDAPSGRMATCQTTDLTGNGHPDFIVGAAGQNPRVSVPGVGDVQLRYTSGVARLIPYFETDVFWYENPGWERHELATEHDLNICVGSTLADVDGDGRVDFVAGQGKPDRAVYWYEQPDDPRTPWTQHLITTEFCKYHDLVVGDVDNDGHDELVGLAQESEVIFYFDVPDDPFVEPWPEENLHVIAEDTCVEGAAIVDIDGDGENELVAGTSIYRQNGAGEWTREDIATGWDFTRVAVADLDGDGDLEVVFSEGDSPTLGTHPGRVAWFDPPDWEPTFLREDLHCPHSLQIADFTGDGRPDVFVGEMDLRENEEPELLVFANQGDGTFEEHVISRGIATHEAKAVDLTGDGRPDIIGKSYDPDKHVDVWYNQTTG